MVLSRYLPNKTLIWKELKTDWLLIGVFWIYVTFTSSFLLFRAISSILDALKIGHPIHGTAYIFMHEISRVVFLKNEPACFILTILVICMAAAMFGLERQRNTFSLLLAMPYSRRDMLYNKFIVGLGQLLIIFALNAAVMTLLVRVNPGLSFPFNTMDVWAWALQNIIILGYIFTFTMLISSISGTVLGNGLLSLIFLFFPLGLWTLVNFNIGIWMDSLPYFLFEIQNEIQDIVMAMTVPFYLIANKNAFGQLNLNLPLAYGIMLVLSGVIYKLTQFLFARNQLENNGKVLMFERLEGFFKLGVVFCFTLLGVPIIVHFFNLNPPQRSMSTAYIFIYLLLGAVSWWFINWLIKWRRMA